MPSLPQPAFPLTGFDRARPSRFAAAVSPATRALTRGVCRLLAAHGYGAMVEFPLTNGRRVDVIGLGVAGDFAIVEIKTSVADFRADRKWQEYLPYCERFYFAVPEDFPHHMVPDDCGLMVADAFGGTIRRDSPARSVNATRKRHQLLRFALAASERLHRLCDPGALDALTRG